MKFTDRDVASQAGKTFVVTGANTGIGFATSRVLASRGARVVLACRSRERGQAAIDRIRGAFPDADLRLVELDQADLACVARAADEIADEPRLDALINNAGIMFVPHSTTVDGFEQTLGVNHLGTFALTCRLLDALAQTPGSRVVVTSSSLHRRGTDVLADPGYSRGYSSTQAYHNSKLANLWFAYELHRRLGDAGRGTIASAVHPGLASTELMRYLPQAAAKAFVWAARPVLNTSLSGAWPTLLAATAVGVEGGEYFGPSGVGEVQGPATRVESSALSRDRELQRRAWDLSVEMTGVDPGI
ncbi:MAG: oxidoreductase [Arachnia sp.]